MFQLKPLAIIPKLWLFMEVIGNRLLKTFHFIFWVSFVEIVWNNSSMNLFYRINTFPQKIHAIVNKMFRDFIRSSILLFQSACSPEILSSWTQPVKRQDCILWLQKRFLERFEKCSWTTKKFKKFDTNKSFFLEILLLTRQSPQ